MSTQVKQLDGRKYTVNTNGIPSLRVPYEVIQDSPMAANGELTSFTGLPAIGSAHPHYPGLFVDSYDVVEQTGKDKKILKVDVIYSTRMFETSGSGTDAQTCLVDEFGWDDGTDEKELLEDVEGNPVLNSAGDPFESVPKVSVPAPTFTKVMRFRSLQSGAMDYTCKVNQSEITVFGKTCPAGSLLCTVAPKLLVDQEDWKYQYTIKLRFKTNKVKVEGGSTATEIGWDAAVTDAGMRALQTIDGEEKVALIRKTDPETGKRCVVASAALLDGNGHVRSDTDVSEVFNFRYAAYEKATFPTWFYSEPIRQEVVDD